MHPIKLFIEKPDQKFQSSDHVLNITLDGKECPDANSFYSVIQKLFHFPDYFGKNLDGLFDCMTDLSWIEQKHIELLICSPDQMMECEEHDTDLFINFLFLIDEVLIEWSLDAERLVPNKTFDCFIEGTTKIQNQLDENDIIYEWMIHNQETADNSTFSS